jgi:predicted phosphodiesterase
VIKKNIIVPSDVSICFVGDIHEHDEQFYKLIKLWKPCNKRWLVSVGDVYDKGFGEQSANRITKSLIRLNDKGFAFAVKGNHELKKIKKERETGLSKELRWWRERPIVLTFEFQKGKMVTVVHAGITPNMTEDDLSNNVEVCFVRDVDTQGNMIPITVIHDAYGNKVYRNKVEGGVNWHNKYNGRFGYVVSGHAASKDGPLYFNNSCNLDTKIYETGILSGQVFLPNGKLGDKIKITGTPSMPE